MASLRTTLLPMTLLACVAAIGCHRIADEVPDYERLRADACDQVCETIDTCDPDRFDGEEPSDCFERCMTLIPDLQQENQCGSRKILEYRCIGALTCAQLLDYEAALPIPPGTASAAIACTLEAEAATFCSTDEPFDLDEVL